LHDETRGTVQKEITIGNRRIGDGHPVYIVAEIGINHNGSIEIAKKLIDAAVHAGCDAVKFQKRTPELSVPPDQRNKIRSTPWGDMTYLEYRYKVEFDMDAYRDIDQYCKEKKISWFTSCWDEQAVDFIEQLDPICYKIASASLTDRVLQTRLKATGVPLIQSTGMSTMEQIEAAVDYLQGSELMLMHSTSTYPCPPAELNLRMIQTLREKFEMPVGYSGHEVGLPTTVAAVALGACMVERHITLDRAMWGSDQAASVEPVGFERLVNYIRGVEASLGDGVKKVYDSEVPVMQKLRRS
jgi:N-acetylneuraminate synthase